LRQIFRGQVLLKGRYRRQWEKSYLFVTSDGNIGMTFPATAFAEEGSRNSPSASTFQSVAISAFRSRIESTRRSP